MGLFLARLFQIDKQAVQKLQSCISGQVNALRHDRNLTRVYLSTGLRGYGDSGLTLNRHLALGLLGMGLPQVKYAERHKRSPVEKQPIF